MVERMSVSSVLFLDKTVSRAKKAPLSTVGENRLMETFEAIIWFEDGILWQAWSRPSQTPFPEPVVPELPSETSAKMICAIHFHQIHDKCKA